MKRAYSYAGIRLAEKECIAQGVSVAELMEKAGLALANAVEEAMKRLHVDDVLFVCGAGNNGGDGFVAARLLFDRGYDVGVLCLAKADTLDGESAAAIARSKCQCDIFEKIPKRMYAVIVDCLFGTGLARAVEGDNAVLIDFINQSGAYVIACDVPSGLGAGGVADAHTVCAAETITMGALKEELILADGADLSGKISVADIGIPMSSTGAEVYEDIDIKTLFPARKSHSNKGTYGTAAILSGYGSLGAPMLSARACLKSGAGYTKLYLPSELYPKPADRFTATAGMPSCIFRELHEVGGEIISADCITYGMGAGVSESVYHIVEQLLAKYGGTLILDADALNSIWAYGSGSVLKEKHCNVIVTPHIKEFSRITGRSVDEILAAPVNIAKQFAKENGVTVVLKNNRTVITDGERVAINTTGSPALAKGGSGDVLSGFLAGTVARGLPPFEAALTACYVLGRAGEIAAKEMTEYASDATDIIRLLPKAIMSLDK